MHRRKKRGKPTYFWRHWECGEVSPSVALCRFSLSIWLRIGEVVICQTACYNQSRTFNTRLLGNPLCAFFFVNVSRKSFTKWLLESWTGKAYSYTKPPPHIIICCLHCPCYLLPTLSSSKTLLNYSLHLGWIQIAVWIFKSLFLAKGEPSLSPFTRFLSLFRHSSSSFRLLGFSRHPSLFSCQLPHLSGCKTLWWAKTSHFPIVYFCSSTAKFLQSVVASNEWS